MNADRDEARKPDTTEPEIETRQLVALLAEFGIDEMRLKNDVRRHFLPRPRLVATAGGRSRVGYWNSVAARRARLLCELRRAGAQGEMLRLLLFLEDGWGWEWVRDTCIEGVRRGVAGSLSGLGRYARRGEPDAFAVERIIAHQHGSLVAAVGDIDGMRPTSEPMARFYLGLLQDGVPLEGGTAKSLTEPLNRLLFPAASGDEITTGVWFFDALATMLDLRPERLLALVNDADATRVEGGRRSLFESFGHIADAIRRENGEIPTGAPLDARIVWGWLANIPAREFAKNPAGATLPHALGYAIAMSIALDAAFQELAQLADGLLPLLPVFMRTIPGPQCDAFTGVPARGPGFPNLYEACMFQCRAHLDIVGTDRREQ